MRIGEVNSNEMICRDRVARERKKKEILPEIPSSVACLHFLFYFRYFVYSNKYHMSRHELLHGAYKSPLIMPYLGMFLCMHLDKPVATPFTFLLRHTQHKRTHRVEQV